MLEQVDPTTGTPMKWQDQGDDGDGDRYSSAYPLQSCSVSVVSFRLPTPSVTGQALPR